MKTLLPLLFLMIAGACTFTTIPDQENITTYDPTVDISHIEYNGGNGNTPEEAVVILKARDQKECRASEFAFLKNKFGEPEKEWHVLKQKSKKKDGTILDVLKIRNLKTDSVHTFYFDISGLRPDVES